MVASIREILHPRITTKVISQIAGASNAVLNHFGMQPGGPNERRQGHRQFGYDIFNRTRTVAQGAAPGSPAKVARRQKVGRVDGTFARMFEHLPISAEETHNYRPIGGSSAVYDEAGKDFVARQQMFLGQRAANFRAVLLGGLIRGSLYAHVSGDDMYYDYTSTSAMHTIDYQMPSGNKTTLNMLGSGAIIDNSWASAGTNIPQHLELIDEALQQLTGGRLEEMMFSGRIFDHVKNNDYVISQAGVANPPYTVYERASGGTEARPLQTKRARIAAWPFVEFILVDDVLELGAQGSETSTKFIGNDNAWFGPRPTSEFFEMVTGSEPVAEYDGGPKTVKMGLNSWSTSVSNPTADLLFILDNCVPANYIPYSNGYFTPVF